MKILASLPGPLIVHAGVLEMLSTILLCYVLAVVNGHVPIWLPMISDCAIKAPEKYPFRLGIVLGASLLALQGVVTYNVNRKGPLAGLLLKLAIIASAGLAVVGVVNSHEDNTVHSTGALTFFICYDIYAVLTLYPSWYDDRVSGTSFVIKCVLAVICACCMVGNLFLRFNGLTHSNALAIVEWSNTFALMGFLWTAVLDGVKDVSISEVEDDSEPQQEKKSSMINDPEMKLMI